MSATRQSDKFVGFKNVGAPYNIVTVQRHKIVLAYRGTAYHGWQTQPTPPTWKRESPADGSGLPTVQGALQRTIGSIVGHHVTVCGSSRTDAGVHALGQVAHFDTTAVHIAPDSLRRAVNARLPSDILIRSLEPVDQLFDAISWTTSKRYEYVIWNESDRPVFESGHVWHRWQPFDENAMRAAGARLLGTHDFASFAKPGHGREHTVRTVTGIDLRREGPRLTIGVEGTGFLWHMVRIVVGTLVEVGMHRRSPDDIPAVLQAKSRRAAGPTAPAHGLYLHSIQYRTTAPPPRPDAAARAFPTHDADT